ncbi:MAG: hypothetical protein J7L25_02570 [Deltaproteobacteria bacterium]|nr:hypothetical protein [Candidatus Tharpella aukensis]
MSPSQIRNYSRNHGYQNDESTDALEIIQSIPTLTKLGAIFLVMGKFMGIMAIPAAFIPALNMLVIPLVIAWGGMVFISIILCSVDHFQKKKIVANQEKRTSISTATENIHELQENEDKVENPTIIIPLTMS